MRCFPVVVVVVLCLGSACRDKDHGPLDRQSQKAVERVGSARDEVASQRKAVDEERQDVARAAAAGRSPADLAKERADVMKSSAELAADQAKLMAARGEFLRSSQAQLEDLGRRIDETSARWGEPGRDWIAGLRRDHALLARIRARVVDDPQVDWREAQQEFITQVNTVEEGLKAMK